jgi:hypothetical protein
MASRRMQSLKMFSAVVVNRCLGDLLGLANHISCNAAVKSQERRLPIWRQHGAKVLNT